MFNIAVQDSRQKRVSVISLKDFLEHVCVDNRNIIDFCKETHFYNQLQAYFPLYFFL